MRVSDPLTTKLKAVWYIMKFLYRRLGMIPPGYAKCSEMPPSNPTLLIEMATAASKDEIIWSLIKRPKDDLISEDERHLFTCVVKSLGNDAESVQDAYDRNMETALLRQYLQRLLGMLSHARL